MNNVERVQKGLDRKGLIKAHNEMNDKNSYNNGLIYKYAKEDCDNNSSLSWEKYLSGFTIDGKQVTRQYATTMTKMFEDGLEIKKVLSSGNDNHSNSLKEAEAEMFLDTTPSTRMELRGENAIQKARNLVEVAEAVGKEKPSAGDIRTYNQAKAKAKESMDRTKAFDKEAFDEATKNAKKVTTKDDKPDYFTAEEEIDFESWCIKEHSFNVVEMKPKGVRAVFAIKDNNVDTLLNRVGEWKSAKKIMAKLCHPDTGGNELAMSMLNDFSELMKSLSKIKDIIDYDNRVEELKKEYSTPPSGT